MLREVRREPTGGWFGKLLGAYKGGADRGRPRGLLVGDEGFPALPPKKEPGRFIEDVARACSKGPGYLTAPVGLVCDRADDAVSWQSSAFHARFHI